VRFTQPTITAWVSSDFVSVDSDLATVTTEGLNLRLQPNLDSPILGVARRNYRSEIVSVQGDFTQIYAPQWLVFAIPTGANSAVWQMSNTPKTNTETVVTNARSDGEVSQSENGSNDVFTEEPENPVSNESTTLAEQDPQVDSAKQNADTETSLSDREPGPQSDEASASPEAQQHRLAPGDTISLRVFGEQDLSVSNLRIPQSGVVSFPLIGSYEVAGKTLNAVEEDLQRILAQGYVRNPRLSVTIDSYRPIFVLGSAQRIGSHPYSEGLTIAKAIAIAGGATSSARSNGVSLVRDGEVVFEDLPIDSQIRVLSGDIISIDEQEGLNGEATAYIYLHGEVRSPGEYEYRRGLTVEKAIVLAGGFTLRASRRKISVSRFEEGEEEPTKLKRVKLYMPIKPGDIIDVGASWL
jgi:polysaccharide export outer membrane protein